MSKLSKEAIEAANDFCEKNGLREHFIKRDLTRAFQSVIEEATDYYKNALERAQWALNDRDAQLKSAPQRREPFDPIQVGGRTTCPRCGEDYSMADIHQCEAASGAASSEPPKEERGELISHEEMDKIEREHPPIGLDKLINGLVDQQAIPDEWWKPELAAVKERIWAALAAEREHADNVASVANSWMDDAKRLERELSAERERIRELERITSATGREAKLVEALKAIRERMPSEVNHLSK